MEIDPEPLTRDALITRKHDLDSPLEPGACRLETAVAARQSIKQGTGNLAKLHNHRGRRD
jgi:hypothetical protein